MEDRQRILKSSHLSRLRLLLYSGILHTGNQNLALLLTSYVIFSSLLNLSEPWFSYLQKLEKYYLSLIIQMPKCLEHFLGHVRRKGLGLSLYLSVFASFIFKMPRKMHFLQLVWNSIYVLLIIFKGGKISTNNFNFNTRQPFKNLDCSFLSLSQRNTSW